MARRCRRLLASVITGGWLTLPTGVGAATEHLQGALLFNHDLGRPAIDTTIILPFTGLELAFNVNLRAFTQKFSRNFSQLAKYHHAVPFGTLFILMGLFITPAFRGGQGKTGYRRTVR